MGTAAPAGDQHSPGPFLSSPSYSSELRPRSRSWTKLSVPFISSWVAVQGNTSPEAAHVTLHIGIGCSSPGFALHPAVPIELQSSRETISERTREPHLPLSGSGLPTSRVTQVDGSSHTDLSQNLLWICHQRQICKEISYFKQNHNSANTLKYFS